MKYALVNKDTREVLNVIKLDKVEDYTCPDDCELFQDDLADIGDSVIDGALVKPDPEPVDLAEFLSEHYKTRLVTNVSFMGVEIMTDELTTNRLAKKIRAIEETDTSKKTKWRGTGGWHTVSLSTLIGLGTEADEHIQLVFDTLEDIENKIMSGTITTTDEIVSAFDEALGVV